jgi:hypothetical protein
MLGPPPGRYGQKLAGLQLSIVNALAQIEYETQAEVARRHLAHALLEADKNKERN